MRFAFTSLVALATAAVAVARPSTQPLSLNPDSRVAHPIADAGTPAPLTNAKRLAKGLPPLSPKAARRPNRSGPHGGTKVDTARRTVSSPLPPVNVKCNILVKDTNNGTAFGFISPVWNVFGEYGIVQPDQAGALEVSFSYSPESPDSLTQRDFLATNGPGATYPFVGATVGFVSTSDDLAVGSYNYAYITGTTQIPAGPPEGADNNSFSGTTGIPKSAESAIWTYNPTTQDIIVQWINTDGSPAPTNLVYANDFNQAFIITGDVETFQGVFGVPYPPITFTCVCPVVAAPK